MAIYPQGTKLIRNDGVQFTADGNTNYGSSYKPVNSSTSTPSSPSYTPAPTSTNQSVISALQQQLKTGGITPQQALQAAIAGSQLPYGVSTDDPSVVNPIKNALFGGLGEVMYAGRVGKFDMNTLNFIPTQQTTFQTVVGPSGFQTSTVNTPQLPPFSRPAGLSDADWNATINAYNQGMGMTTTQAAGVITQAGRNVDTNAAIFNTPEARSLSPDKLELLKAIYGASTSGDPVLAGRVKEALDLILRNADPALQAQIRIAQDTLTRSFLSEDQDLQYKASTLQNKLNDLTQSTAAQKEYLSLEEQQQLKNLQTKYEQDLETTRQNLAATGKTVSSARIKSDQLLNENNQGLVQTTKRQFGFKQNELTNQLMQGQRDTQAQIDYYRQLAERSKIDTARKTEGVIGSDNLPNLGGIAPLGGIVGSLPSQNYQTALNGALNFVF